MDTSKLIHIFLAVLSVYIFLSQTLPLWNRLKVEYGETLDLVARCDGDTSTLKGHKSVKLLCEDARSRVASDPNLLWEAIITIYNPREWMDGLSMIVTSWTGILWTFMILWLWINDLPRLLNWFSRGGQPVVLHLPSQMLTTRHPEQMGADALLRQRYTNARVEEIDQ